MKASTAQGRAWLGALVEKGALDRAQIPRALQSIDASPSEAQWWRYVNGFLLGGGAALMAAGVIFLVAYNWAELTRLHKFAFVQVALALAAGSAIACGLTRAAGRAALAAAVLILGALLALFGQTYQTGADPWQLFGMWALLALPWVGVARSAVLWCLWLVIVTVALWLWFGQVWDPGVESIWFGSTERLLLAGTAALHTAALGLALLTRHGLRDAPSLLCRFAAAVAMGTCMVWGVIEIWNSSLQLWLLLPLLLIGAFVVGFEHYRPDVPTAAFAYGAAVVVGSATVARALKSSGFSAFDFSIVALSAIGLTVFAVKRLQSLAVRVQHEGALYD